MNNQLLKSVATAVAIAAASIGFTSRAEASIVTQTFNGQVTSIINPVGVPSQLSSLFSLGVSTSGSFQYDTEFPAIDMTQNCGTPTCPQLQFYMSGPGSTESLSMQVGALSYHTIGGANGSVSQATDIYSINFFGLQGAASGELSPSYAAFYFQSSSPLPDLLFPPEGFDSLPLTNTFVDLTFALAGCPDQSGACYFSVRSSVEQISNAPTGVPVPEPSTIALIGMALLSLFGFGMMRRRADA